MKEATHVIGGLCADSVISALLLTAGRPEVYTPTAMTAFVFLSAFAAIIPNIDDGSEPSGEWVPEFIQNKLHDRTTIFDYHDQTSEHRASPMHTIKVGFILSVIVAFFAALSSGEPLNHILVIWQSQAAFLIFFGAYCSHLLLDMMTVQGVPIFYPYTVKYYRIAKMDGSKKAVNFWIGFLLIIIAFAACTPFFTYIANHPEFADFMN